MMGWYQLIIESCQSEEVETLTETLEELNALSVMCTDKNDDPVLEPEPGTTPLWPEVVIEALFAEEKTALYAQNQMLQNHPAINSRIEFLPDQDWERVCMDSFKPQQFGENLWICPTWLTPPVPDAFNVILDPGLAFGTGMHPTTSLCLTWLAQQELQDKSVIDYGCGSGILSLAALKLGAKHVHAVDIDNQALQATWNNAKTNQIHKHQLTVTGPEFAKRSVDVILANILLNPLMTLKTRFHQLLNEEALLVVSGILSEQVPALIECYEDLFFHRSTHHLEDWSLVVFSCKNSLS